MTSQQQRDFEDFMDSTVDGLAKRGHILHTFVHSFPYRGCAVCGQGTGALQHNIYLIRDYEFLKFMAA